MMGENDSQKWKGSSDGVHSVKSCTNLAYEKLYVKSLSPRVINFIWQKKAQPRAEILA